MTPAFCFAGNLWAMLPSFKTTATDVVSMGMFLWLTNLLVLS